MSQNKMTIDDMVNQLITRFHLNLNANGIPMRDENIDCLREKLKVYLSRNLKPPEYKVAGIFENSKPGPNPKLYNTGTFQKLLESESFQNYLINRVAHTEQSKEAIRNFNKKANETIERDYSIYWELFPDKDTHELRTFHKDGDFPYEYAPTVKELQLQKIELMLKYILKEGYNAELNDTELMNDMTAAKLPQTPTKPEDLDENENIDCEHSDKYYLDKIHIPTEYIRPCNK